MVRVVIIGAGFVGKIHADAYQQIDDAKVVAVVDSNEEKGRALADSNNAVFCGEIEKCADEVEFDSVDICVPTYLHRDLVFRVAKMKKHIFCEKPMALTLSDADSMIDVVKTTGCHAMIGHVVRFGVEYSKIREIVTSGDLGTPLHAFCQRLASLPDWHSNSWGTDEESSGGAALDLHIHDLDYLIWLFGKPVFVTAQGVYNPSIIEKGGFVHIDTCVEFEDGMHGFAEGGWAFGGAFPFTKIVRVLCEKGTVEFTFRSGKNIENRSDNTELSIYMNDGAVESVGLEPKDPFVSELEYFVHCVRTNSPVTISTFEDGRKALALALAAIESAKERKTVEVTML